MYRGAILKSSYFYIDDEGEVKIDVELDYKGEKKNLTLDVKHEHNLIMTKLINDIYNDNFKGK